MHSRTLSEAKIANVYRSPCYERRTRSSRGVHLVCIHHFWFICQVIQKVNISACYLSTLFRLHCRVLQYCKIVFSRLMKLMGIAPPHAFILLFIAYVAPLPHLLNCLLQTAADTQRVWTSCLLMCIQCRDPSSFMPSRPPYNPKRQSPWHTCILAGPTGCSMVFPRVPLSVHYFMPEQKKV